MFPADFQARWQEFRKGAVADSGTASLTRQPPAGLTGAALGVSALTLQGGTVERQTGQSLPRMTAPLDSQG